MVSKTLLVFVVVSFAALALHKASASGKVKLLNEDTYCLSTDEKASIVMYCDSRTSRCKKAIALWNKMAEKRTDVQLMLVDCAVEDELCYLRLVLPNMYPAFMKHRKGDCSLEPATPFPDNGDFCRECNCCQ